MSVYQLKDRAVTDAAVEWIRTQTSNKNADGGFSLTVGYMLPHPPYVVDAEIFDKYEGRVLPPRLAVQEETEHPYLSWWRKNRGIAEAHETDVLRARAAYWGLVHRLDGMIGELLSALEEKGILDDTLVVYASDHGDHVGERGLWWKHTFHEESVKIPLVMRLPQVLPASERRSEIVNLVDLSQTMLEAMGGSPLPHADGRSFWSLAKDASAPWVNETYSEYCTDTVPYWTGGRAVQQRMIRSGRWKLIAYDNEPLQLFDLQDDPDELENLAEKTQHADLRNSLLKKLFDGWDAESIAGRMRERRVEKDVVDAWAKMIQPKSEFLWPFDPADNFLQGAGSKTVK